MLIILFLITTSSKLLSGEEKTYIIECLNALNITEEELCYEKKWVTDTIFRLKRIDTLLDNPLYIPDYVASFTQTVGITHSRLTDFLYYLSGEANLSPGEIVSLQKEIELQIQHEKELPVIFAPLIAAFKVANKYWEQAVKELHPNEVNKILMYAPVLWGSESDSLDICLKGVLHREFNISIDTMVKVDTDTILELSKKIDRVALSRMCFSIVIGFESMVAGVKSIDFKSMSTKRVDGVEGDILLHVATEFGNFVIGGVGDNIYYSDFAVIIDPKGNDIYKGRAGGGIGVLGNPFSIVVDIVGNDTYLSYKLFNFGASVFGVGILVDIEGNDTYRESHYSLGAGLFGLGVLVDSSGNDIYEGGYFTQGAGNFGLGVLMDYNGNDVYKAYRYAQGMGGTLGYGLLIELDGADLYYSGGRYLNYPLWERDYSSMAQGFAIGVRPDAGGGIGILYDKWGSDFYNGGVYSQGAGYWYSLGMLIDEQGNDWYNAVEYAQGAGIHLAVGILIDNEGTDHYFSRAGPAQGEGHDLSVGFLMDKNGDDTYFVSGGQGIGLANAVGIFVDSDGNDTYVTTESGVGQGSGKENRGFPSVGIFLDLKGIDKYMRGSAGEDTSRWLQGKYGAGMDLSTQETVKEGKPEKEIEEELEGKSIDELFKSACLWEVGTATKKVRKARNMLIKMGEEALEYIFPNKLDTKSGLVVRAIKEISDSLQPLASPLLINCLKNSNLRIKANAVWMLGEIKDSNAVDSLLYALNDFDIKPRLILKSLGDIEDRRVVPNIIPYLKAQEEPTRIYACYALQKLKDHRSITYLIGAMADPYFTVRNAAEKAIIEIGDTALSFLVEAIEGAPTIAQPHIIRAIGILGEKGADTLRQKWLRDGITKYLAHSNSTIRGFTVDALIRLGIDLEVHMKDEKDPFIISRYKQLKNSNTTK